MENFSQFLHMGGYGSYIWPAFAAAAIIIIAMTAISVRSLKRAQKTLRQLGDET